MEWRKIKSVTVSEFELLGVEREPGKPAFALMAEPGTRKYVGSAFITLAQPIRERLWKRVQEHAGPPPKEMRTLPSRRANEWQVLSGDPSTQNGRDGIGCRTAAIPHAPPDS